VFRFSRAEGKTKHKRRKVPLHAVYWISDHFKENPMPHITWSITRRTMTTLLVLILLLAAAPVVAQPAQNAASDFAAIDAYVERQIGELHIPGLALGIVEGDQIVHLKGFGVAGSDGRPVTPQTPFPIGKLSKTFTTLAVMQLVEAGKLDLNAPIQRYLPSFRVADEAASARITVRHLLTQTSGLSHAAGLEQYAEADLRESALEQQVRDLNSAQLAHPVGAAYEDSSANAWVLGLLIQTVSAQPYGTYVQQQIFAPLAMHQSFTAPADAAPHHLVSGYHYWFGQPVAAEQPFNRGYLPASGLIASVEDMTHFLVAQLNEGRYASVAMLSGSGIAELHRPAISAPGPHAECLTQAPDCAYGMGWGIRQLNGVPAVIKSSDVPIFAADVVLLPSAGLGVVLLMNANTQLEPGRNHAIAEGVTSLLLGQQPPAPAGGSAWMIYLALLVIVTIQVGGMVWSLLTLRRWRAQPERRPQGRWQLGWHVIRPLVLNLVWALVVLAGIARLSLPDLLLGAPDLASVVLASSVGALLWGIIRTVLVVWVLRATSLRTSAAIGTPAKA
jgi:CubicO group peptidase (beta-lactamase class C family)